MTQQTATAHDHINNHMCPACAAIKASRTRVPTVVAEIATLKAQRDALLAAAEAAERWLHIAGQNATGHTTTRHQEEAARLSAAIAQAKAGQ